MLTKKHIENKNKQTVTNDQQTNKQTNNNTINTVQSCVKYNYHSYLFKVLHKIRN